ncbi:hyphally regulated cell wall protein, partial [Scheffersomyces stipitis CBS 6054]
MKILRLLFVAFLAILALVSSSEISQNTIDRGFVQINTGDYTIDNGITWSIIDVTSVTLTDGLTVGTGASFYVSTSASLLGLSVSIALNPILGPANDVIVNNGLISLNGASSLLTSSFQFGGASFTNTGQVYMGVSGGSLIGSTMSISTNTIQNTGLIVYYQAQPGSANINIGASGSAVTNNGQICLYNAHYSQNANILGTGCITLDADSELDVKVGSSSFASTQIIYMTPQSTIGIPTFASGSITINGFGGGNTITINIPLALYSQSYSQTTGTLTIRNILTSASIQLVIGSGYISNSFTFSAGLLGLSVTYSGNPPNPISSLCATGCGVLPVAPGDEPTEYTTVVTTTNSNAQTTTGTYDVLISNTVIGTSISWYTSSSLI